MWKFYGKSQFQHSKLGEITVFYDTEGNHHNNSDKMEWARVTYE